MHNGESWFRLFSEWEEPAPPQINIQNLAFFALAITQSLITTFTMVENMKSFKPSEWLNYLMNTKLINLYTPPPPYASFVFWQT